MTYRSIFREGNKKQKACTTSLLATAYIGQCTSEDVEGVVLHIVLIVCEFVANVDQAFINLQGPLSQQGFRVHARRLDISAVHAVQSDTLLSTPPGEGREVGGRRISLMPAP